MNLDSPVVFMGTFLMTGIAFASLLTLRRETRDLGFMVFIALIVVLAAWALLSVVLAM